MTTTPNPTDDDLGEVTVVREFDAPRELVYRAFVEPAQLAVFWGPDRDVRAVGQCRHRGVGRWTVRGDDRL